MNKITIVKGEYLQDVAKGVIKQIDATKNNLLIKHLCIVPDRFSLITEKLIFDVLGISSTLNISVLGINKLAKQIIKQAGLNCLYISDEESKMLVRRAMQKTKKDFVCFSKNITYGVCEEVQKTLSQIKSSGIGVSAFEAIEVSEPGLCAKLHDLAIIYAEYQNLLGERMDAPQILNVFASLIENQNFFENTKFYFIGFDSLTSQGYEILKRLSKKSEVTVGALCPNKKDNAYIYDTELLTRLRQICEKENIQKQELEIISSLNSEKQALSHNLFCYKPRRKVEENNYVQIYESSDMSDEVMFVAKKICELTKNQGYRYRDICICADASYYPLIRNHLEECDIVYFDDQSYNLENSLVAKFVENILDLRENGFKQEDILKFLYINFLGQDKNLVCDAINKVNEFGVFGKGINCLTEVLGEQFEALVSQVQKIQTKATISDFCQNIIDILELVEAKQKTEQLAEMFKQQNNIFLEKVYLQVYDKLENCLLMLEQYIGDEQINISDFSFLFCSGLKTIEIRSVPMSVDCVFVGDSSESFYSDHKVLFVIGANEGVLPMQTLDSGLVSDKDIDTVSKFVTIEPSVKIVNKRNKFKLYDLLLLPQDKLYITYKNMMADGKTCLVSNFVENIFSTYQNFKKIELDTDDIFYIDKQKNIQNLCFNNPNEYFANININNQNVQNALILKNALESKKCLKMHNYLQKNTILNAKRLFFANSSTKVSQIESYYSCPFAHFLKYGIKLKEQKTSEIKANYFGNFLHRFSQIFIQKNKGKLGCLDDEKIKKQTTEIIEWLCKNEFEILQNPENKFTKNLLIQESIRFAEFINLEQSHSKFKPTKLEQYFGAKQGTSIKINVQNENYDIVGIVDRIDEYDDHFRIIDYKTGSLGSDAASYDSLFYGKKIQIFVYLKATEALLGKKCFGVFYLPISNAYNKEGEGHYKMKGFFVEDEKLICAADDSLTRETPKSRFFEAELSTGKTTKGFKLLSRVKKFMQKQELEAMTNYAIKLVENAIQEICDGNIEVSPFDKACDFCEFKNLCRVEILENKTRKKIYDKITSETFVEVQNGEN